MHCITLDKIIRAYPHHGSVTEEFYCPKSPLCSSLLPCSPWQPLIFSLFPQFCLFQNVMCQESAVQCVASIIHFIIASLDLIVPFSPAGSPYSFFLRWLLATCSLLCCINSVLTTSTGHFWPSPAQGTGWKIVNIHEQLSAHCLKGTDSHKYGVKVRE